MTPETDTAKGAARADGSGVGVQLVGLRRSFGPTRALDELSIDIAPKEGRVGISEKFVIKKFGFSRAVKEAFRETWEDYLTAIRANRQS